MEEVHSQFWSRKGQSTTRVTKMTWNLRTRLADSLQARNHTARLKQGKLASRASEKNRLILVNQSAMAAIMLCNKPSTNSGAYHHKCLLFLLRGLHAGWGSSALVHRALSGLLPASHSVTRGLYVAATQCVSFSIQQAGVQGQALQVGLPSLGKTLLGSSFAHSPVLPGRGIHRANISCPGSKNSYGD